MSKMAEYLESVGLQFHPFDQLEASADSRLTSYLIEHEVADKAWKSDDCSLVGESGSGRTAIAEGLLHDCRVGRDISEIFPILLRKNDQASGHGLERPAAIEALLQLAYQPEKFEVLGYKDRADLVGAIESASPGILDYFLPKFITTGSHLPVCEFFDPPSETLPNHPSQQRVIELAGQMRKLGQPENLARSVPSILDIVPAIFGLTGIKLIADFKESPTRGQLEELDRFYDSLSQQSIVSKVILVPAGPESGGQEAELINWSPEQLVDVLSCRIKRASGGEFNSLDGISDLGLDDIENKIVNEAAVRGHRTPRAVLSLAKTLLELQAQSGAESLISSDTFQQAVKKEFANSA